MKKMQINSLIILCFLFTSFTGIAASSPTLLSGDHIFINCGSTAASTAFNGREWLGDLYPKFSSSITVQGSSTRSSVNRELMSPVDPVPYKTARISRSQFSYTFQLNPGQKFIRLHFNPTSSYTGFQRFNDFFTVEAGPFTLLANFSASITADALAVKTFAKEFCIIIQENQPLNVVFTPSHDTYAFINGIEIISVPSSLSYGHGGDAGVQVVGHKSLIYIDNTTALEMVHRQNIVRDSSVVSADDIRGVFRIWATILKGEANKISNMSWKISVDVGFRYLIRIHFSELGLRMAETGHKDFTVLIDRMIASTSGDILHERVENGILWYKNYMVMVKGRKQEGKRDILVSLHSKEKFVDGFGPLEGFEIFKLSNDENSLASPSLLPPTRDSSSQTIQMLHSVLGRRNVAATIVFAVMCVVSIIVHMLQQNWGVNCTVEENRPSTRVKRLCRCFPLAEIQSATEDFFDGFVIGKGGFGKVYKGLLGNGQETVAIKRLKSSSKQGKREFWTEVETLSELRHINLVPLIGYCNEQQEMILVYEYMPCGTLADHLYKLARKRIGCPSLSWKQRLKICIGAGRGLDYLHTGHGIIHRDIKASNILLDEKLVAKVSDFGLAKIESGSELQSQASTNLKGTFGYIDPDYFRTHTFTTKSDTYSFGVVLLEVLCGRPAVEREVEEDKRSLAVWARDNISKGEVDQIVAPSLRGEISPDSLKTFVTVAERCLLDEPKKRPTIAHVVIKLELALEQQENAESSAPKEITSVADLFLSNDKNMNSSVPNERAIVADVSPQKENVRSSEPNVADAMPCTDESRQGKAKSLSPNEKTSDIANEASPSPVGQMLPQPNLRIFTFSELKVATRNFRDVCGKGRFGRVYKGWLVEKSTAKRGSGTVIAVKKLNSEITQGFQQWQSEVNFLGRLSHPNLVKLLGYGWEDKELLLVYEFMQKGSLENHLFGRGSSVQPLPWDIRLKILIGAARGLAFLHASGGKAMYKEFKSSNILLDGSYHAKISDFGLAGMGPTDSECYRSTWFIGTRVYAAPEYVATGHLYVKSDVYGFGVVLVEMLTGLRALDTNRPSGQHTLVDWIKPHLSERRKLKHIIDMRLEGIYPSRSALQIAQLALNCLESEPKNRPSKQEIVETLERINSAVEKPKQPRQHF